MLIFSSFSMYLIYVYVYKFLKKKGLQVNKINKIDFIQ